MELFQPTRPLRGATSSSLRRGEAADFNPRAPCGARRSKSLRRPSQRRFQPTRPLRGATTPLRIAFSSRPISTHAPLAGRDCKPTRRRSSGSDFNPRAPCGARRLTRQTSSPQLYFNPRAPCGARHKVEGQWDYGKLISTHAPLAGRDNRAHPCPERRPRISTHAPLAGRDPLDFAVVSWL